MDQPKIYRCKKCSHSFERHDTRGAFCKHCTCTKFVGEKPDASEITTQRLPALKPKVRYCALHGLPIDDEGYLCAMCELSALGDG